jgi:hypothetical protein
MTNKRVLAAVGGIGTAAVLSLGLWLGNGMMSTPRSASCRIRRAGRLLRTAVFLVHDRHLAEDLLHSTYERVSRRRRGAADAGSRDDTRRGAEVLG